MKSLKLLLSTLILPGFIFTPAQDVRVIRLKDQKIELKRSNDFYIESVTDQRSTPSNRLGTIISEGGNQVLTFGNLPIDILRFWRNSSKSTSKNQIPVQVLVNQFNLSESRNTRTQIAGAVDLRITLQWNREDTPVKLTEIQAKMSYTRGLSGFSHDDLIQKTLVDALKNIDTWFKDFEGKTPGLVKSLQLTTPRPNFVNTTDTTFYSFKNPLNWSDFRAKPSPGRFAAMVFTSFAYEGSSQVIGDVIHVKITPKVYVVRDMSWVRQESKTAYTLAHEQLHFDITFLVAQQFIEHLSRMKLSVNDYDSEIQYQFLEYYRKLYAMQKRYDDETAHGINKMAQQAWIDRIKKQLEAYR